jgi:hypothetical protein
MTTTVLTAVLATGSGPLLAAQAVVFAIGSFAGPRWHPYGQLYRAFVASRLGPPTEWEHAAPVRFAQAIGLVFALIGTIGYATGFIMSAVIVTCFALGAAFLNAAFGICLGCELYLRLPLRLRQALDAR